MGEQRTSRQLDCDIAQNVLDYHAEWVKPSWYAFPVLCFYRKGSPLIKYSYDENGCNAMMFRNGVDDSAGTAPPLPQYSENIEDAWEVVEKFHADDKQFVLWAVGKGRWVAQVMDEAGTGPIADCDADTAPEAICLAALAAPNAPQAVRE